MKLVRTVTLSIVLATALSSTALAQDFLTGLPTHLTFESTPVELDPPMDPTSSTVQGMRSRSGGRQSGVRVGIGVGIKKLKSSDWDPVDDHTMFGIQFEAPVGGKDPNLKFAAEIWLSEAEETESGLKFEAQTMEILLGVRYRVPVDKHFEAWGGGGLAFVRAELKGSFNVFPIGTISISDDDVGFGVWFQGGMAWRITDQFSVGGQIGYTYADIVPAELFGAEPSVGGFQASLVVGFSF